MDRTSNLIVVGNGMVGHKLVEALVDAGGLDHWRVTVFGEEPRPAYDRVALSSWFTGTTADELCVVAPGYYEEHGIDARLGDKVVAIDREARTVLSARGTELPYDHLVLATGSYPFVPPVPGSDADGVFVYRTIDDLEAIKAWSERPHVKRGAVIGGGLLGLEAANALTALGLQTHVLEFAPRLMPMQLDDRGGATLQRHIEGLGVYVHPSHGATEVLLDDRGMAYGLSFDEHDDVAADLVVFSAGIRPRDELARQCALAIGERGGVVVDDHLVTSDPDISAVGEVALYGGHIYGLVAPGYEMARVVARRLAGDSESSFTGADLSTKLKLLGVDVASFGDAFARTDGARELVWDDPINAVYKKLVVSEDGEVLGGMLVGDASAYSTLLSMTRGDLAAPADPAQLLLPESDGSSAAATGVGALADGALICSCNSVTKGAICSAVDDGCRTIGDVKSATTAGTGCGGCVPLANDLLKHHLAQSGFEVNDNLCEHFAMSRQDLFALIRVRNYTTFSEVLQAQGSGMGCEICKPAVASILASLANGYILDGEQAALQDTNDHFLANLQRDGTYSVVPRIPGGEITPERLIVLGEVARDYDLYTKITGGQRIDLFGARVEQLPAIWRRLVDAGFESGHAYGKAVRTVKSCVGSTWCRYGVQDSVAMAIAVELRYRGLRAPHKIKMAVSGCARECAEAMGKDIGVIATEKGWNLYVCGNGGQRPRHAVLFAEDLDDMTLIKYIDRVLMLYIRTADRLERTATWFEKLDGGIDYLRSVVIDDSLGIGEELEADMQRHVDNYECEWKATVDDPERLKRFVSFVNAPDEADPDIVMVAERGQVRPARADEKRELVSVGAVPTRETTVEVRTR